MILLAILGVVVAAGLLVAMIGMMTVILMPPIERDQDNDASPSQQACLIAMVCGGRRRQNARQRDRWSHPMLFEIISW
jgi:hypothetical protein